MFDECQLLIVEGLSYDWINETIRQLKASVKKTKMPIWYFLLKLIGVKVRPFVTLFFLVVATNVFGIFFTSRGTENTRTLFDGLFQSAGSIEEKIKILYDYVSRPTDWSFLISYAIGMGVAAIIYAIAIWLYPYLTPPSMFLFGAHEKKLRSIIVIYNFVYVTVLVSGIGIPLLISYFSK